MARLISLINLSRKQVRIGTTKVAPASKGGAPVAVDLDSPVVRRDLHAHKGEVAIVRSYDDVVGGGAPLNATLSAGAESANAIDITLTVKSADGQAFTAAKVVNAWLGTSGVDPTLVTTAPDGGVAAGTGTKLVQTVANKFFKVYTSSAGVAHIVLTHSLAGSFYLWVELGNGQTQVQTVTFV